MLTIDRLKLRLPPGFEARATEIARLVTEALADLEFSEGFQLETLAVPHIPVASSATDREVAHAVVEGIHTRLTSERSAQAVRKVR